MCQAIPCIIQLMKCHLSHSSNEKTDSKLIIDGRPLLDKTCNNKFIHNAIHAKKKKKSSPRGKFFWSNLIYDVNYKKAWLLPYKFCLAN